MKFKKIAVRLQLDENWRLSAIFGNAGSRYPSQVKILPPGSTQSSDI